MTRNEPPRRQMISTKWLFVLGIAFVLFGIFMIVFFPNA